MNIAMQNRRLFLFPEQVTPLGVMPEHLVSVRADDAAFVASRYGGRDVTGLIEYETAYDWECRINGE